MSVILNKDSLKASKAGTMDFSRTGLLAVMIAVFLLGGMLSGCHCINHTGWSRSIIATGKNAGEGSGGGKRHAQRAHGGQRRKTADA